MREHDRPPTDSEIARLEENSLKLQLRAIDEDVAPLWGRIGIVVVLLTIIAVVMYFR